MEMLLKIENLDVFIGSTQILRNISLGVNEGEIVCLLGRNGAGKSSIIKSTIGLYPSRSGKIIFNGKDITPLSPRKKVLSGIGYSPEDTRIFTELTVEENINLSTWVRGKGETFSYEKIFTIFPKIKSFMDRKGLNLSGGEKKMVSVARALALNPSLLLLDEAFEGLAPLVVNHFMEALNQIRKLGVTILLAESNVRIVSQVTERTYIIERGEIIFEGHPREILENERLLKLVGK
ncbi:MAG: ABC transporter ATP-binding protein [Deltaproteobacteria bacterium]|nr:ABC transporter ATP-binding protein [Deltaproteobacteria bacterium]MBM4323320.1 ABC transporter ATP-binding protein [Deltaproteobacteria bacterium]MBM4347127.1 ABC transporter ATP-binding protein [Deltaproteobacteria bacterium]